MSVFNRNLAALLSISILAGTALASDEMIPEEKQEFLNPPSKGAVSFSLGLDSFSSYQTGEDYDKADWDEKPMGGGVRFTGTAAYEVAPKTKLLARAGLFTSAHMAESEYEGGNWKSGALRFGGTLGLGGAYSLTEKLSMNLITGIDYTFFGKQKTEAPLLGKTAENEFDIQDYSFWLELGGEYKVTKNLGITGFTRYAFSSGEAELEKMDGEEIPSNTPDSIKKSNVDYQQFDIGVGLAYTF